MNEAKPFRSIFQSVINDFHLSFFKNVIKQKQERKYMFLPAPKIKENLLTSPKNLGQTFQQSQSLWQKFTDNFLKIQIKLSELISIFQSQSQTMGQFQSIYEPLNQQLEKNLPKIAEQFEKAKEYFTLQCQVYQNQILIIEEEILKPFEYFQDYNFVMTQKVDFFTRLDKSYAEEKESFMRKRDSVIKGGKVLSHLSKEQLKKVDPEKVRKNPSNFKTLLFPEKRQAIKLMSKFHNYFNTLILFQVENFLGFHFDQFNGIFDRLHWLENQLLEEFVKKREELGKYFSKRT